MRDHYAILGLPSGADAEQIRRAYAERFERHSASLGRSEDAEAALRALGEAYEVLNDPSRRLAYDRELAAARAREPAPPAASRAGSVAGPAAAPGARRPAPPAAPGTTHLADPRPPAPETSVPSIERGERAVHFGCGALFGGVVCGLGAARALDADLPTVAVAALVGAVGAGALAAFSKDAFWGRIGRRW